MAGIWDTVAGAGDWAAGGVDEAVGRQFDDEPGGGIVDADTWVDNPMPGPIGDAARSVTRPVVGAVTNSEDATEQALDDGIVGLDNSQVTGALPKFLAEPVETVTGGASDAVENATGASESTVQLAVYAVIAAAALYLLRPLLTLAANATGGDE